MPPRLRDKIPNVPIQKKDWKKKINQPNAEIQNVQKPFRIRHPHPTRFLFCFLQTDYDLIDYLNELREGILESYQGIIQGLKGDAEVANPEVELVKPYVQHIIAFIEQVAQVRISVLKSLPWNLPGGYICTSVSPSMPPRLVYLY